MFRCCFVCVFVFSKNDFMFFIVCVLPIGKFSKKKNEFEYFNFEFLCQLKNFDTMKNRIKKINFESFFSRIPEANINK